MRKLLLVTLVGGLAISGCAVNPNTGQPQLTKAGIGALIGAAGGALVDKDKRGRGAILGAVVGSGVGYYMQRQEEQLRAQTQGTGIELERDPKTGTIDLVMPGNITFATNSDQISGNFVQTLNNVARTLSQYDKTRILVKGHTDSVGNAQYNQKLSERRAYSVASYLNQNNVNAARIQTAGYGMTQPVASNANEAGRAQNRRVEITILPPQTL